MKLRNFVGLIVGYGITPTKQSIKKTNNQLIMTAPEINDDLLNRLCSLAKLNIKPDQRPAIKHDLAKILAMIERLSELDTSQTEPLIHVTQEVNHLRLDIPEKPLPVAGVLQNAPKKDTDYIRVPKVVDK